MSALIRRHMEDTACFRVQAETVQLDQAEELWEQPTALLLGRSAARKDWDLSG